MKTIWLKLSLAIALLISFQACETQEKVKTINPQDNQQITDTTLSVEAARLWFESDFLRRPEQSKKDSKLVRKTFWDRAFKGRMSNNQELIVVPIEHHELLRQPNVDTYLWIFKDDTNRFSHKVIEYLSSVRSDQASIANFTGTMTVRDWDGTLLNGFSFKDGKPAGLLKSLDGEEPLRIREARNGRFNGTICDQVHITMSTCTDYYYKVCINGNCTDWSHNGTFCGLYEIVIPQCYWVADFPGQTSPYTGSTMLPGGISVHDYNNNLKLVGPKKPIANLKEKLKCFGANGVPTGNQFKYKMTLYVDQPINKSTNVYQNFSPDRPFGHTYLGLEQYNSETGQTKRLVVGFYIQTEWRAGTLLMSPGAWGEDGNTSYDVSISLNISANQFQNAIDQMGYLGTPSYHITDQNCNHVATNIMAPFLAMPDGVAEIGPLGLGMSSGALGQGFFNNTSTYGQYMHTGNNLTSPPSTSCP